MGATTSVPGRGSWPTTVDPTAEATVQHPVQTTALETVQAAYAGPLVCAAGCSGPAGSETSSNLALGLPAASLSCLSAVALPAISGCQVCASGVDRPFALDFTESVIVLKYVEHFPWLNGTCCSVCRFSFTPISVLHPCPTHWSVPVGPLGPPESAAPPARTRRLRRLGLRDVTAWTPCLNMGGKPAFQER